MEKITNDTELARFIASILERDIWDYDPVGLYGIDEIRNIENEIVVLMENGTEFQIIIEKME